MSSSASQRGVTGGRATASAVAGVIIVFLGLVYWAAEIFNLFSAPLTQSLPKNGRMIVPTRPGLGLSLSERVAEWTAQEAEIGTRA